MGSLLLATSLLTALSGSTAHASGFTYTVSTELAVCRDQGLVDFLTENFLTDGLDAGTKLLVNNKGVVGSNNSCWQPTGEPKGEQYNQVFMFDADGVETRLEVLRVEGSLDMFIFIFHWPKFIDPRQGKKI